MWGLCSQLTRTPGELANHIRALRDIESRTEDRELFGHLYTSLTILDTKSASLLQFDSILIAVYSIYLVAAKDKVILIGLLVGVLSILLSSIVLLNVVWVHWSTTSDLRNPSRQAIRLLAVRNRRTVMYRIAWYGAVLAVLLLIVLILFEFYSRLPIEVILL
jgi:hypothetical protein